MAEIVRFVVWHPIDERSIASRSPERAWQEACKLFGGAAWQAGWVDADLLKAAGWHCSEVRTDAQ